MKARLHPLDLRWLLLLAATALGWWLTESGGTATVGVVGGVWGLAGFKGALIALDFMALREAPPPWRRLVLGWLAVVVAALLVLGLAAQARAASAGSGGTASASFWPKPMAAAHSSPKSSAGCGVRTEPLPQVIAVAAQ